jgi:hypothetical protein
MENTITQQEILLFTNTSFCARMGFKAHETGYPPTGAGHEKLEDACWKGLIPMALPEISRSRVNKDISLWEINRATNFLDLQFAESPRRLVTELSVNPYLFMGTHRLN